MRKKLMDDSNHCPKCGSDDITVFDSGADYKIKWDDVRCNKCDQTWSEIYTLTDVEELD